MSYCPHCRHCHPRDTPAAQVVSGRVDAGTAPLLTAVWAAVAERLTGDYQPRKPLALDVSAATGCADSTVANLVRAAILEGLVDQVIRRDDDGHYRAHIRTASQKATR